MTATPIPVPQGFEEVLVAGTPFYRVSVQVPSGVRLTKEKWDLVKSGIAAQIDSMKDFMAGESEE